MSAPILATKLYIPPPRPNAVPRPQLISRLDAGLQRKLTLLSAPAGYGKSTLLSEWVAGSQRPAAWLSLDEGDGDPARFLSHFIAALQTCAAHIGEAALGALHAPQPPSSEAVLISLLNEIASLRDGVLLILDDYHLVDAQPIDDALAYLIERLPPQMHLAIATREDPDLPLARLRARDQLTELRLKDLRFSLAEAAGFLHQSMGLPLSSEQVAALEARTEGWIAGLHLAALALQGLAPQGIQAAPGRKDTSGFILSFTGSHHYVMDYLLEEVLQQQSESLQNFLLCTSILDRLCGPLCDAVLGSPSTSGPETLEYLERANLLVVPLDDQRRWYRYHHLFADVLRARLMKSYPDQLAGLHRRASTWWEQHDFRPEAIRHALAAADFERAADLIELEWSVNSGTYFRNATWLGWVQALPDELVRTRPRLSLGFAWEMLFSGQLEAAADRIRDAQDLLERTGASMDPSEVQPAPRSAGEEAQSRSLRASLALARAFHAQALGDAAGTVQHARGVLALVAKENQYMRGLAGALLGLACWSQGDLGTAHKVMDEAMASLRRAGSLLFANSGTFVLADIQVAQGRLLDAIRTYQRALELVSDPGEPVLQGTADLYLGLSELYRERGDSAAAQEHLLKSEELGRPAALDEWPYRLYLAQARMRQDQGDLDGALELLEAAEALRFRGPVPDVRPAAALKARLWIQQGRLDEARDWARRKNLSAGDDLSYLGEFEHLTLVRLLIARYQSDRSDRDIRDAFGLLERLLAAAEAGGRMGTVIEILVLGALAQQASGSLPDALDALERALALAEPQGYVRIFVDEGEAMAELLGHMEDTGPKRGDYVRKLLAVFAGPAEDLVPGTSADRPSPLGHPDLVEPLSRRELEVLQLIAQGLSNQQISERLYLALSTVKGHNRNIFGKLQVERRTEAVARARELGLV